MEVRTMKLLCQLITSRDGNFAVTTAFLMMPLLLVAGMAVDFSTALATRTRMQDVADSAALAGAGIYDGTNQAAAMAMARKFLTGYGNMPKGLSYSVAMNGQNLQVAIVGQADSHFMKLAGMGTTKVGVLSQAIAPLKPKTVTFKPTKAQGYYYKKVSILVVRPGSTSEQVVGTVEYQPVVQQDGGQGTMTVSPSGDINLGKYSKLILQMEIKNDGCGLGKRASVSAAKVTCNSSSRAKDLKYNLTLRTDDPSTSHYLFVDGKQLPKNVSSPLDSILECDKTSNHAWEDGGGFERQDFFYTAKTTCAPDGEYVRLTM
jgi:Flp pilus assembly protein TadG